MTNFDFLLSTPAFASFSDVAISAEKTKRALKSSKYRKTLINNILNEVKICLKEKKKKINLF